jgi:hypothetical protein
MRPFRIVYLFPLLACSGLLKAQEIKFIDLTFLSQRTALRHPPAPPPDCKEGNCSGGGSGGGSVSDGAPDWRDPRALGIYLFRVSPTDIDPAKPFQVDFQVRNTGTVSLDIPVSSHLSDLQPIDESVAFSYFSLALVVAGAGEPQCQKAACTGYVELYGSSVHAGTMIVLKPGEGVRVRANVKLLVSQLEPVTAFFRGDFWLRNNTFKPVPGGGFTEAHNLYPNTTSTPVIALHLLQRAPLR